MLQRSYQVPVPKEGESLFDAIRRAVKEAEQAHNGTTLAQELSQRFNLEGQDQTALVERFESQRFPAR